MDSRTNLIIALSVLLAASLATAGFLYWQLESQSDPIPIPPEVIENEKAAPAFTNGITIDLYFLTMDHTQFAVEKRLILEPSSITGRIRQAMEELLRGTLSKNLIAPIPEQTKLQSVFFNEMDGRAYISFSKELIANNPGHALSEWAAIYSIVNTAAAQSAAVKEVQILVDGEIINSDNTLWDWSLPFQPDPTFVRYAEK
ncbi:MAG: GerMN domain-containing protein [bacterium]